MILAAAIAGYLLGVLAGVTSFGSVVALAFLARARQDRRRQRIPIPGQRGWWTSQEIEA